MSMAWDSTKFRYRPVLVKRHLHGEDCNLRDPRDHAGEGEDEDEESKVDVDGEVEGAESGREAGGEEGDEAGDPLEEEEGDADDADPGVEAVHVGDGRRAEVVVVEDGLQPDDHERQRRAQEDGVRQLHLLPLHVQGPTGALMEGDAPEYNAWK